MTSSISIYIKLDKEMVSAIKMIFKIFFKICHNFFRVSSSCRNVSHNEVLNMKNFAFVMIGWIYSTGVVPCFQNIFWRFLVASGYIRS